MITHWYYWIMMGLAAAVALLVQCGLAGRGIEAAATPQSPLAMRRAVWPHDAAVGLLPSQTGGI